MPEPASQPLHVAMVAPPWFELPPGGYGGIEAMCAALVDQLVLRGHRVTLLAAGRNGTRADKFFATYETPPSQRLGQGIPEVVHAVMAAELLDDLDADVVHDHSFAGPLSAGCRPIPTVVTAHGPVNGEFGRYYRALGGMVRLVAISHAQVRAAPEITWAGVVHNAVPVDDYPFRADKDGFVLSLGRLDPSKGAHLAVDAARAAGRRLVLAGKCTEPPERRYFDEAVRPRLGPDVEWLGEVDNATKLELLAGASCLLFPLQWEEPFGMVMIEAMACGTPVVALRRGAVPEVVAHGSGGLVCDRADELPAAIEQVGSIDPAACRRLARERFDVSVMAAGYESLYARCVAA